MCVCVGVGGSGVGSGEGNKMVGGEKGGVAGKEPVKADLYICVKHSRMLWHRLCVDALGNDV